MNKKKKASTLRQGSAEPGSATIKKNKPMNAKSRKLFEEYYFELRKTIHWYIYRKVNKQELSEDITAEVFIKLAERPDILEDRDINGVKAWLYTVARNKAIDYYRKQGRKTKQIELEDEIFEIVSQEGGHYLEEEIKAEDTQFLLAIVEGLTAEEKEIIMLRFNEEMQFADIAKIIGKKEGAIKMTLYRALTKLKETMEHKKYL